VFTGIDFTDLVAGTYVVQLVTDRESIVRVLVVEWFIFLYRNSVQKTLFLLFHGFK